MNKINLIVLLVFLGSDFLYGQVLVSGKIVDSQTSKEIPFAHVLFSGTPLGTTSNLYGNFNLEVPESVLANGFKVTCLGYQPYSFQLTSTQAQTLLIELQEDIIRLEEVVIKPETPENLMKQALQKIPDNYDTSSYKLSGYYKMTSLLDGKNAKYTEAYLDIVKPTFREVKLSKKGRKDSTHFREVRTIPSEIKDWKLKAMIDWESTPRQIENRDIVKQFLTQRTYDEFMSLFDFELESMVYIDGRRNYKINLAPKKSKRNAYWNGSIFIDEETKAFVKIDFISSENMFRSLKRQLNYKLMSALYKVKYDQGQWKERVSYKLIGDKWYLNEVNSSKQFLISSKKRSLSEAPVDVTVEYKTDSARSNFIAPDSMVFLPYSKNWWENAEYIESLYDSAFWSDFDSLRPQAAIDNQEEVLSYYGKVVDERLHEPISDALIYLKNASMTNVSNSKGEFLIRIPATSKSDTLFISHFGYSTLKIPMAEFDKWNGVFSISTSITQLEEIEVFAKRITADDIMQKVADSRKQNFTSDFFKMEGYYRHQLKIDNEQIAFIEVALDLMDDDYQTYKYRNGIAQETVVLNGI